MKLRKILSALLCVAMLASCLSMTAIATETDDLLAGRVPYNPESNVVTYQEETKTVMRNVTTVSEENGQMRVTESQVADSYTHYVPVEQEEATSLLSVGQIHENVFSFTDFADLKLLAAVEYTDYVEFVYNGTEPLVISEDLHIPAYMNLQFANENPHLIINEGVTFETSSYSGGFEVDVLEVKGTFIAKSHVYVSERLEVSGELIIWEGISVRYGAQIIGAENIKKKYDSSRIYWHTEVSTFEQLAALAQEAAASTVDYSVNFYLEENVTLRQNLVIPANMTVGFYGMGKVTIPYGVTLTLNSYTNAHVPMVIEGTLELNNPLYYTSNEEGGITFTSTGRLVGRSYLSVNKYAEDGIVGSYTDFVQGLDPAKIFVEEERWQYEESLEIQWKIYPSEGKTKLSTPTDLQWNKAAEWDWDSEKDESFTYPVDKPASSMWKCGDVTQNEFKVTYYLLNTDGTSEELGEHWYFAGSENSYEYYSVEGFGNFDPETGDYYFTVQSIGDGVNYVNSDIATSGVWHYVKPEADMGTCYDLQWNWPNGSWMSSLNTEEEPYYEIDVLYTPVSFQEPHQVGGSWTNEQTFEVWDDIVDNQGVGYYYFRVRIVSDDVTKLSNGAWSELSPAFKVTHVSDQVSVDLDTILGNTETMTQEEIRQSVQELDTEELRKSMEADHGASGVIEAMKELEAAVGGPAAVAVNTDAAEFDASKVSVVGANLNNVVKEDESVTLVIDKPQKEHVMDTMYDNSVSVTFSMTLDNVEDAKNLAVPVMITLPIPASINPDFLVVLHYGQDGSVQERILPHIFREGPQWYASFTLTSFSDFTMTQVDVDRPTVDMFRMYDPNSGEHFYTGSEEERENLVAEGWNYEGVGFTFPLTTGDPVHRLYDPVTGEHLYTMDENEMATLMYAGWNYEGIAFNSAYDVEVPQYRLHNPNATRGAYHFTASQMEVDYLISEGWEYQGIGWYSCGVIPE